MRTLPSLFRSARRRNTIEHYAHQIQMKTGSLFTLQPLSPTLTFGVLMHQSLTVSMSEIPPAPYFDFQSAKTG